MVNRLSTGMTVTVSPVVPSLSGLHNRWLMRITDLSLKCAPKLLREPTRRSHLINLLNRFLHCRTLTLQLVNPRPHAIHPKS
ncbi:hypothetical protein Hanom_Chr17g01569561 [Helianthus anomalus]